MIDSEVIATLSADTATGRARLEALQSFLPPPEAMEWVEYQSSGRLVIIGPADRAWPLAEKLAGSLDCVVLATERSARQPAGAPPATTVHGRPESLTGHLGAFEFSVEDGSGVLHEASAVFGPDRARFDLVLDLNDSPVLAREILPPGYFHAATEQRRERAVEELPHMIGEFQKPRFFAYDASICAHGARGLNGCSKCIDACATDAAFSIGDKIAVDPYLCQGCGSCATVCPTGAIRYAAPPVDELLDALRPLFSAYRRGLANRHVDPSVAPAPAIVLYSGDGGAGIVQAAAAGLPEHWLPVAVEDVGSIGPDCWFSLLAYGAGRVILLTGAEPAAGLVRASRGQIEVAESILRALGDRHAGQRIALMEGRLDLPDDSLPLPALTEEPATFGALGDKREVMRLALGHLYDPEQAVDTALPVQAPFGGIDVDRAACTLCMACVSVCPASAIQAGGDLPRLNFREDRCVQCGLCATACPETAITLDPRMNFAAHLKPHDRVLNEQEMQHCGDCGKAFATRQMIDRMVEKLAGHWMYQSEQARARLRLCEDCRIKQMWDDDGPIDVHPPGRT